MAAGIETIRAFLSANFTTSLEYWPELDQKAPNDLPLVPQKDSPAQLLRRSNCSQRPAVSGADEIDVPPRLFDRLNTVVILTESFKNCAMLYPSAKTPYSSQLARRRIHRDSGFSSHQE